MVATVLIIGSGAREHALATKLSQSPKVSAIYVAPGNGGTEAARGKIRNIDVKDVRQVIDWCTKHKPSLVVVGPEDPLDKGISDELEIINVPCFGPGKEAAQIECSKAFAKDFMKRHNIPTARFETFTDALQAKNYIRNANFKALVVKASGLAGGKGVVVAKDVDEACQHVDHILKDKVFGAAGNTLVVEELLVGDEVSVLAFTDGKTVSLMPPAQDHKRAYENDEGPNTGGMGAYCPCHYVDENMLKIIEKDIIQKTVDQLRKESKPFKGVLYAGLMLTESGPKVLEFNCRFGDPETQSILPLLDSDLYDICLACATGKLDKVLATGEPKWKEKTFACGVVVASEGYPAKATNGQLIGGLENVKQGGMLVFHGGSRYQNGEFYTSGGRILTVVGLGSDLVAAAGRALLGAEMVEIEKSFFRLDIAKKAKQRFYPMSIDYKSSGVDIEAGDQLVQKIKKLAGETIRSGVVDSIGGFGALFDVRNAGYFDPILVSGTDGVGTKLKLALETKIYDTVGVDLVAMCVNDILVQGAEPLFFLDYFACGKLNVNVAAKVISGISRGCREANCALIGGETAEMPGMYSKEDFDLAGFSVGAVDRNRILPKVNEIEENDVVIGLPSSGVHSNGFSLVRKLLEVKGIKLRDAAPFDKHSSLGEILLTPTKIYVKSLYPVIKMGLITALAHITGGGLIENIPRILKKDLAVHLDASKWQLPQIFSWIQKEGNVSQLEMLRTFNCGIGMVIIVKQCDADAALNALRLHGEPDASIIGRVIRRGDEPVIVDNFGSSLLSSVIPAPISEKKRVAVLISGSGTNLQALIDHTSDKSRNSAARIVLVVSNIPGVEGLKRAERVGIPTKVINHKNYKSRSEFDKDLAKILTEAGAEIICLAGFMRILTEEFVRTFKGNLINIHPSLLPSFPGINTHKRALEAGIRIHGTTVHFVDTEVDTGPIILQEAVPILLKDTEAHLQERVKHAEHRIYPQALEYVAKGQARLDENGKLIWNL